MNDHGEFVYGGILGPINGVDPEAMKPTTHTNLGTPQNLGQPAMDAARIAYQIKQTPVESWKQAIADAPEALRERVRAILLREWEERKGRAEVAARAQRRASGGHQSAAGDRALAELAKKLGVEK